MKHNVRQQKAALIRISCLLGRVKLAWSVVPLPASPHESCRNGQAAFLSKMTTVSFPAAGNAFLLRNAAQRKLYN